LRRLRRWRLIRPHLVLRGPICFASKIRSLSAHVTGASLPRQNVSCLDSFVSCTSAQSCGDWASSSSIFLHCSQTSFLLMIGANVQKAKRSMRLRMMEASAKLAMLTALRWPWSRRAGANVCSRGAADWSATGTGAATRRDKSGGGGIGISGGDSCGWGV